MHTTLENAVSLWKRMILSRKDFFLNKNYLSFYCKIPKNKPWGLHFSKALFEGFIFEGAYIRRGLSMEGNFRF